MSSSNPSIRSKKGERVAFSDCKLEPLNLLIPGGAPILVPKHKAWPGQKKRENTLVRVPLSAKDSYDATEEDKDLEERPAPKRKSSKVSQAVAKSEKKAKGSCKKESKKLGNADIEGGDRKKLEQRVKEQEDYIAKLKAKYAGSKKTQARADNKAKPESDAAVTTSSDGGSSSGAEATDGSEEVREMLSSVKIKAAGADADPFTPSEDAQILARKEAGESFRIIAEYMKRPRKQISKRYNELLEAGKTVDTVCSDGGGEGGAATDVATDAATAGESTGGATADAEKTDGESDAPVADGDFGGLFDLGELATKLEAVVAEQDDTDEKEERPEDKKKKKKRDKKDKKNQEPSPSKKPKANKKGKDRNLTETSAGANAKGGESGYESGSEAIPEDIGARLYINQYAKHLLRDKDTIPEADERFDEDDCILLALAEGHHRHGRWEQIQARFANLTGRMVPLEVLKYKFGEGEKPEYY
ncbi:hypothetical protein SLS53_000313 [Cytospora paraplurivora]|uniref:Myb-like domain-containing protein n=1 Tax=Cytospora paraplurivora TaxID=2898453 RepID=A0AAN9YPR6_9PEZI